MNIVEIKLALAPFFFLYTRVLLKVGEKNGSGLNIYINGKHTEVFFKTSTSINLLLSLFQFFSNCFDIFSSLKILRFNFGLSSNQFNVMMFVT